MEPYLTKKKEKTRVIRANSTGSRKKDDLSSTIQLEGEKESPLIMKLPKEKRRTREREREEIKIR